jgi:hypothetical protein
MLRRIHEAITPVYGAMEGQARRIGEDSQVIGLKAMGPGFTSL